MLYFFNKFSNKFHHNYYILKCTLKFNVLFNHYFKLKNLFHQKHKILTKRINQETLKMKEFIINSVK